jgi:hypothetical protein
MTRMSREQQPGWTDEECAKLIESQWESIAAFAWNGFVSQGRGIVFLNENDPGARLIQRAEGKLPPLAVCYVSETQAAETGGWQSDEIETKVSNYNPGRQVVIVIMYESGRMTCLCATPAPGSSTPSQSAGKQQRMGNGFGVN